MSCLGNCGNCNCEPVDLCTTTDERHSKLDDKLKVLKDYACLLARTTCVNLAKRVGQYAYYLWCFLGDITDIVKNLEKRVDALCATVKCQDKRISQIIDYLNAQLQDSVEFAMSSSGSTGADGDSRTFTKIDTKSDGSFTINWNMVDNGEVGKGTVNGKVNHSYEQAKDGSIVATIKSFTLTNASYVLSGGTTSASQGATFSVMDNSGNTVWSKSYHPTSGWSETINQTVNLDKVVTLQPKGGTSGDIPILRTLDRWVANDTVGYISANYTNNNSGVVFVSDPCPTNCTACEHKEG